MPKFLAGSLYLRGKERDKRQKFFIHITAIVSLRGGYETEDTESRRAGSGSPGFLAPNFKRQKSRAEWSCRKRSTAGRS